MGDKVESKETYRGKSTDQLQKPSYTGYAIKHHTVFFSASSWQKTSWIFKGTEKTDNDVFSRLRNCILNKTVSSNDSENINSQKKKFFLENLLLARFLSWRDISRDLFFREDFELFFLWE